jgi:elongation factor 1-gamma
MCVWRFHTFCLDMPTTYVTLDYRAAYKNLNRWFNTIINQPQVKQVVGQVSFEGAGEGGKPHQEGGKGGKGKGGKDKDKGKAGGDAKKATPKKKEPEPEDDEPAIPIEKPKDPMGALNKGSWDMDDFKRFYSNNDEDKSIPYFWEKFDPEHYSIWRCDYKYANELNMVFMSCNLIGGGYCYLVRRTWVTRRVPR